MTPLSLSLSVCLCLCVCVTLFQLAVMREDGFGFFVRISACNAAENSLHALGAYRQLQSEDEHCRNL
jgi:hypothetical protein